MARAKTTTDMAIELLSVAMAALGEEVATRASTSRQPATSGFDLHQAGLDIATLAAACAVFERHRRLIG
jgi:hypothetical protein